MHNLLTRHDPHTIAQVKSCDGSEHATHRELTGKVLYFCNCGYVSGWQDVEDMGPAADFIAEHTPPGADLSFVREPGR